MIEIKDSFIEPISILEAPEIKKTIKQKNIQLLIIKQKEI